MTRQHSEAFAREIRDLVGKADSPDKREMLNEMAERIAAVCNRYNANFNADQFLTKCGV